MKTYEYVGNCVSNPFRTVRQLCRIIETSIEITEDTFMRHCKVPRQTLDEIKTYPDDFTYHRGKLGRKFIYYYVHSCIEHFFVKGEMVCVQETESYSDQDDA